MPTKGENKRKNDNKTPNSKSSNVITHDTDPDMTKPVRGLPKI